jgi:hypothetical protein
VHPKYALGVALAKRGESNVMKQNLYADVAPLGADHVFTIPCGRRRLETLLRYIYLLRKANRCFVPIIAASTSSIIILPQSWTENLIQNSGASSYCNYPIPSQQFDMLYQPSASFIKTSNHLYDIRQAVLMPT